jgi:hypothetical protein
MSPSASVTMFTPAKVRRLKSPAVSSWSRLKRGFREHDVESSVQRVPHQRLEARAKQRGAGNRVIGEFVNNRPTVASCELPTHPQLVRNRCVAGCPTNTGRRWRPSMQCHLGLCLSLRCDFPLEAFTRGLASEGADQHAQRLSP